jgi:hypothetical protein
MQRTHIDPVLPTGQDALLAGELRHALDRRGVADAPVRVQVSDATALDLPPIVAQLLMTILEETASKRKSRRNKRPIC